jgi:hypothetical protein
MRTTERGVMCCCVMQGNVLCGAACHQTGTSPLLEASSPPACAKTHTGSDACRAEGVRRPLRAAQRSTAALYRPHCVPYMPYMDRGDAGTRQRPGQGNAPVRLLQTAPAAACTCLCEQRAGARSLGVGGVVARQGPVGTWGQCHGAAAHGAACGPGQSACVAALAESAAAMEGIEAGLTRDLPGCELRDQLQRREVLRLRSGEVGYEGGQAEGVTWRGGRGPLRPQ